MRRSAAHAVLLPLASLLLLPSVVYAQHSTLDTQLPVTAVERRACAHMLAAPPKDQSTDIWFNPFVLKGIAPEPGLRITGYLFPRTPFFTFYYAWQRSLVVDSPISFPAEINCVVSSPLGADGKIRWTNVPDGDYYVAILTTRNVTYSGETSHTDTTVDGTGVPIGTNTTYTPYSHTYTLYYLIHQAIQTKGGTLLQAKEWGVAL